MNGSNVPIADLLGFAHSSSSSHQTGVDRKADDGDMVAVACASVTSSSDANLHKSKLSSSVNEIPKVFGDDIALHYETAQVTIGDELDGVVKAGNDWTNFWFQPLSLLDLLADIEHNLELVYNDKNNIPSVNTEPFSSLLCVGFPCVARYTANSKWYRAKIRDIEYELVEFVDYGNSQMCSLNNVKPLTKTLAEICPPLAFHCRLADFHNPLLPSFVFSADDKIRVTVQNKREPFEVSVQMLSQRSVIPGRPPVSVSLSQYPIRDSRRRVTRDGLTLPPTSSSSSSSTGGKFVKMGDDDDDIDKAKKSIRKPGRLNSMAHGKLAMTNIPGFVSQIYATCGQITPEGVYKGSILDFNSQETCLNKGSLNVEDLSRIIRLQDRFICSARYEDVAPGSGMKPVVSSSGSYQMTNMETILNTRVLISHATVNLLNSKGAQLFIRGTNTYVYAPASSFPSSIVDKLMDRVQIGRTVLVRAAPREKFLDLEVNTDWMAVSVELLGVVEEHQGWMYFVRDIYSVVLTDGGIGFGYVFVDNNFVNAGGLKREDWYGSRVLFRACMDVPDVDRFGFRWRALTVTILPEHTKGPYRYPGVFRPSSASLGEGGPPSGVSGGGKKAAFDDDSAERELDLPEEAVQEMAVMGKDVIGINRSKYMSTRSAINEVAENLLNEREEIPAHLLFPYLEQPPPPPPPPPPPQPAVDGSTTAQEESRVEIVSVIDKNNSTDIDLIGFSSTTLVDSGQPPPSVANGSASDLLGLWEGSGEASEQSSVPNGLVDPLPTTSTFPPLLDSSSAEVVTLGDDDDDDDDNDEQTHKDVGTQVELQMQLLDEVHRLKACQNSFAIVFAEFMKAPPAAKNLLLELLKEQ